MLYYKFEIIGKNLFGSSWKKQMADNLFIDHRRIQDWSKRGTDLPEFVEKELKFIAERRLLETQFASNNIDSFDHHAYAVLMGEIHYLEIDKTTKEDIEQFIKSQKYRSLQIAWRFKQEDRSFDEIKEWLGSYILGEDDIADWCKENDFTAIHYEDVQYMRGDNLGDIEHIVSEWFE